MAIRAWLKVPCNNAGGSRAPGRDSAFPHLLCKAGKPPEAGKIHRAETRQQSLCIRAQISCGWRDYPSLCPACGAPEAALHHHPHGIHHTTSPPASQPWPAAVGIPKISLCSVGLLSHPSTPAWLPLQSCLPALSSQASLGLHCVPRQLPALSKASCLQITPKIHEECQQCLPAVTDIKTPSRTAPTHLSAGER